MLVLALGYAGVEGSEEIVITTPEGEEIVLVYLGHDGRHRSKIGIQADRKFEIERRPHQPPRARREADDKKIHPSGET